MGLFGWPASGLTSSLKQPLPLYSFCSIPKLQDRLVERLAAEMEAEEPETSLDETSDETRFTPLKPKRDRRVR